MPGKQLKQTFCHIIFTCLPYAPINDLFILIKCTLAMNLTNPSFTRGSVILLQLLEYLSTNISCTVILQLHPKLFCCYVRAMAWVATSLLSVVRSMFLPCLNCLIGRRGTEQAMSREARHRMRASTRT